MTRDEFRQGISDMVDDMATGAFDRDIREGREMIDEVKEHDPVLASKLQCVLTALEDVCTYVKARSEQRDG